MPCKKKPDSFFKVFLFFTIDLDAPVIFYKYNITNALKSEFSLNKIFDDILFRPQMYVGDL